VRARDIADDTGKIADGTRGIQHAGLLVARRAKAEQFHGTVLGMDFVAIA
jgi:hypothetical protein